MFKGETIITQMWVHLEEYWLEDIFSCRKPMSYNVLFRKEFVTVTYKVGPQEVPIENLNDISQTIHPNNSPVVEYKQNDESSCCFGSLESSFADIGDFCAE